jgi:acetylornithine deacetylase
MNDFFSGINNEIRDFLFDLTSIPSISHAEADVNEFCFKRFSEIEGLRTEKQYIIDSLMLDPMWSPGPFRIQSYAGHFNIILTWHGYGADLPIYLNAHTDTVAPCVPDLMPPKIQGNRIQGLGVHDDKAHIATIFALFRYLSNNNIRFPFDIIAHLVVEEEIGGNGTLFAVRNSVKGQAAIILDGCEGHIYHACRGAIWPRITCFGESCHPSDQLSMPSLNAYDRLKLAMSVIKSVQDKYCEEIKTLRPRYFENLLPPLNVGEIHAGNWPSTVPTSASASMVFGFFPGWTASEIRDRINLALASEAGLDSFYEPAVTESDHPFVTSLEKAFVQSGLSASIIASNAACDVGYYRNQMNVPSVNTGIGEHNMHSKHESVEVTDILRLANGLATFFESWS